MARRLQTEDLLAFRLVGDVQLSPAGDRVAYVLNQTEQEQNKYQTAIYMTAPGGAPTRFTGGDSDASPRFSPDGSQLAFVSRRSGQAQVWVMGVLGGEARQLTRVQGGVGEFAWAPDGASIAFTALLKADGIQPEVKEEPKDPDLFKRHTQKVKVITELFHKLDGVGYMGERRASLCVIGLAEGAAPVQLTQPPYQVSELAWTPDSTAVLFSSRMGADYDRQAWKREIYVMPVGGGESRSLTPESLSCSGASVSPDGAQVAFYATPADGLGYDNQALWVVPLVGGEAVRLAAPWDRTFDQRGISDMPAPAGGRLTWAPDGERLFTLSSMDGTTQLVSVELETGGVTTESVGDRMVYTFSLDGRCRKAALGIADPLNPGDLYYLDLREGSEERLTQVNEELLAELELSTPRRFHAQASGGPDLDGWVMPPADLEPGKQYPTILNIHGGPMMMYASAFFFEFQLLAAQGYAVVYGNPRGSQGYGQDFCAAIDADWGDLDYADLIALLDTAIAENPFINADQLGVTGGSYGGFMTNWIVGHTDRFKAAVTGRSICDWRVMVGTGDGGPEWIRRSSGKAPWEDDSWYKQQSPISYVGNVVTPILIEHQEGDLRCPVDQGMMWYSAIKYLGKAPVRFVVYPEEFHGMSRNGKPWNRIHRLGEVTGWFDRYLKADQ